MQYFLDIDKRLLVDTNNKMLRSKEELELLVKDMESYLKYYSHKSSSLKSEIDSHEIFADKMNIVSKNCHNLMLFSIELRNESHLLFPYIIFFKYDFINIVTGLYPITVRKLLTLSPPNCC